MAPLSRAARAHGRRMADIQEARSAQVGNLMGLDEDGLPPPPHDLQRPSPPLDPVPPPPTPRVPPKPTVVPAKVEVVISIPHPAQDTALDTKPVEQEATALVAQADALVVTDPASCARAKELYDTLGLMEKTIEAHYQAHVQRAYVAWKGLTEDRAEKLKPVLAAKKALGLRAGAWEFEQRQKEAAEQRAREAQALAEQQAAARQEAEQLAQQGDVMGAAEVLAEAKTMPAPTLPPTPSVVPRVVGTTTKVTWEAAITDWPALRAAIGRGEHPEFDELLMLTLQGPLTRLAGTLKGTLGEKYPGVVGREKPSLTRTGR